MFRKRFAFAQCQCVNVCVCLYVDEEEGVTLNDKCCTRPVKRGAYLEHLASAQRLQPIPPRVAFTKKLGWTRGNGIGIVTAGEAAPPAQPFGRTVAHVRARS